MSDQEEFTDFKIGGVFYCDGSSIPPGRHGWGVHGFTFENVIPKKGAGHPEVILTKQGYIEKNAKDHFTQVTPISYYDVAGCDLDNQSNNVAELKAILAVFRIAKDTRIEYLQIFTDSEYVQRGIEEWSPTWKLNNWIRRDGKPIPNTAVWKDALAIISELRQNNVYISISWLKGHTNLISNTGNIIADKLAGIGSTHANNNILINQCDINKAEGYWSRETDKHSFFGSEHKRLVFSTDYSTHVKGMYFLVDSKRDERINKEGKKENDSFGMGSSEATHSVIKLKQPNPVIETLVDYNALISYGVNTFIIARLDKLLSSDVYDEVTKYGSNAFLRDKASNFNLRALDKQPLTREQNPPRHIFNTVSELNNMSKYLEMVQSKGISINEDATLNKDYFIQDITDLVYEEDIIKNKKGDVTKITKKLNTKLTSTTEKIDYVYKKGGKEVKVPIVFGVDILGRNSLKKLEEKDTQVFIMIIKDRETSIRYYTIIRSEGDWGIWGSCYTNLILV